MNLHNSERWQCDEPDRKEAIRLRTFTAVAAWENRCMAAITTLFFDVGGVLLTKGWDRNTRRQTAERHESVVADFETGRLTLDDLDRCAFVIPFENAAHVRREPGAPGVSL